MLFVNGKVPPNSKMWRTEMISIALTHASDNESSMEIIKLFGVIMINEKTQH